MNQRIQKLIEQATEPPRFPANIGYFDREKFAELIVLECANELLKWKSEPFPLAADCAARIIKEHFGVKQ